MDEMIIWDELDVIRGKFYGRCGDKVMYLASQIANVKVTMSDSSKARVHARSCWGTHGQKSRKCSADRNPRTVDARPCCDARSVDSFEISREK